MLDEKYDPNDRMEEPVESSIKVERIEVNFDIPVYIRQEQQRALTTLLDEIARDALNQPKEGVHWLSGMGSKPNFSKRDAAFLGVDAAEDAPDEGEPTFDDTVFECHTTARAFLSEKERERTMLERCPSVTA